MNTEVKSGYKQTEVGLIPEDWFVTSLGKSFGKITTGKLDANAMSANGEYPFFTCAKDVYRINDYAFDCDALLISGNGANVGYIHHYNGKFNAYQRTYVLTDAKHDIHYLKVYTGVNLQERLRVEVNAGNTPYIVKSTLSDMLIGLPKSSAEQQRIAFTLADIDALISSLDQLIAKKRDIQQVTMQQLLTGQSRLPGFSGEWEVKKLGDLVARITNGCVYTSDEKTGVPITRIETISDGNINWERVGYAKPCPEIESYKIQYGDILYSHINSIDHIGKVARYSDSKSLYHGMNLILLRPASGVDSDFLFRLLGSERIRRIARVLAKQAVSQASINTKELRELDLTIPSFDEQTAIAAILSDMDTELAALEARRDKARQVKQGMMQELLTGKIRLG